MTTAQRPRPAVVIYCDGACSPNPGFGGWAALLRSPRHEVEKELSGAEADTTNNRMELTAAIRALEALKVASEVDLHTDSQYVIGGFSKGWVRKWTSNGWRTSSRKPVLNEDLWRALLALTEKHEVRWHWVRGHSDSVENNRVDALAVRAREQLAAGR